MGKPKSPKENFKVVEKIADHNKSSSSWTSLDALQDFMEDLSEHPEKWNKILIISLNDTNGVYETGFCQAGLKMSEVVALCEVMKCRALGMMNFFVSDDNS